MKLIDLTKVKQTHKATVAAGKEPTLKLGVLGIQIYQKQSTGDTSRPARPLRESHTDKMELFLNTLHAFDVGPPTAYSTIDYDENDVLEDAIKIARLYHTDPKSAHAAWQVMHEIARDRDMSAVSDVVSLATHLKQGGVKLVTEQQEFVDIISNNANRFNELHDHLKMVISYTQHLEFIRKKALDNTDADQPLAAAALQELGVL